MQRARIAIVGDYDPAYVFHQATGTALQMSAERLGLEVDYVWIATDSGLDAGPERLTAFDGVWAAPGAPYRSLDGALAAIRYAREQDLPFVGT
jgi:CTP synthase (UTP-ammonia lyase)